MTRKRSSEGAPVPLLLLDVDAPDAANSSLSDSPSSTSPQPPAPVGETPAAPRVRKRRRHEVLQLQAAAEVLELELRRLTQQQQRQQQQREASGAATLRAAGARAAAKRARQAVARARLENAKLREALAAQVEIARALQEVLAKRRSPAAAHELCVEPQQDLIPFAASTTTVAEVTLPTAKERAIFDELHQIGDARAGDLVAFVRRGGLAEPKSVSWLLQNDAVEVTMALNEHKCVCIDFIHRYILPFDFRAGAHVIWTQVLSKVCMLMSRSPTHTEVIADTDNVLVTKQSTSFNYMTDDDQFTTEYAVSKRIAKANSVEFLWDSVVESAGPLFVSPESGAVGVQLVQEGWGSVAHVSTVSGTSAASVIQAYIRLTPSMVATEPDASADPGSRHRHHSLLHVCPRFDVGRLSTLVVASYRKNAVAIRRFIENRLIDDMLHAASSVK